MIPAASSAWASPTLTFYIFENYQIPANTDTYVLIKTELVNIPAANFNSIQHGATVDGLQAVPSANFYTFYMYVQNAGGTVLEARSADYINLPVENVKTGSSKASMTPLVRSIGLAGCMFFELTVTQILNIDDQLVISFPTIDNLVYYTEEYTETVGYTFPAASPTPRAI